MADDDRADSEQDDFERQAVRAFVKAGRFLLVAAGLLLAGGMLAYTVSPWAMVFMLIPAAVFLVLGGVWLITGAIQLASEWGRR
jgi:hypothetical protein